MLPLQAVEQIVSSEVLFQSLKAMSVPRVQMEKDVGRGKTMSGDTGVAAAERQLWNGEKWI